MAAGLAAALPAHAASNPVEIGSQSGAMQYCRDKAKSDDERVKYNVLQTTYMADMQKFSPAEKNQAFVMQAQVIQSGAYRGKRLDRNTCGKLYEQFTRSQIIKQNRKP
jgi:hypothetical protein